MNDDYNIAVRKWAAAQADSPGFDWLDIADVTVESDSGYRYSSITFEDARCEVIVSNRRGERHRIRDLAEEDAKWSFVRLLHDILAIEITDDERRAWQATAKR